MSIPISGLPAVASALLTDIFPIVQSGVTYKEALSQVATLFNSSLSFLPLSGGTLTGALNLGGFQINNVGNPTSAQDAATKSYVDTAGGTYQPLNANLTDISGLSTTLDTLIYGNGTHFSQVNLGVGGRVIYVDANGSDTTGDGSVVFPFATIFKANSVITGNSVTNRWIVSIGAGTFNESNNILLKPYTAYVGRGYEETTITSPNNLVGADPSFATSTSITRVAMAALRLDGTTGLTFDLNAVGGTTSCLLELTNIVIAGNLIYKGRASGDYLHIWDPLVLGNIQISNTLIGYASSPVVNGTLTIDTANNTGNTLFTVFGGGITGAIAVTATSSATNTTYINACQVLSTITVTGSGSTLNIDAVSQPILASNLIQSGSPTVNFVTSDYGINASYTPVNYTPTAPTVDGNFRGIDTKFGSIGPGPFQPLNGNLTDISGLTPTNNNFIKGNGTHYVSTTLVATNQVYVDFVNGSDSTGNGSQFAPWQSIQHAYTSITPSFANPYTIFISGQFDGTDSGTITGKPNVNLVGIGSFPVITNAITISGIVANDVIFFQNLILEGNVTWVRNDASEISLYYISVQASGVLDFEQNGSGVSGCFFYAYDSFLSGLTSQVGQVSLNNTSCDGIFNFKDAGSAAFFQASGGNQFNAAWTFNGGVYAEFAGVFADTGYTITGVTTGSGTPTIATDCSSIPPTLSGAYSTVFISQAEYINSNYTPVNYTPTTPTVDGNFQGIDAALATFMPFTWTKVSVALFTMVINHGYIANSAGVVTFTLPAVIPSAAGIIRVAGYGAGGWSIVLNAGQTIHFGNIDTTTTTGSISSTNRYDSIELLSIPGTSDFVVLNQGQFNVV